MRGVRVISTSHFALREIASCLAEMVTHERHLKVCFDCIRAEHDFSLAARARTRENARAHPNGSFRCSLICI